MHIFMDEAGTFSGLGGPNRPSVVGSLVIPERALASVEADYLRLRSGLPKDKGEVKGRQLSEGQVASVIELLHRHPVLFEATAIDLGVHTEAGVAHHRAAQAERIAAGVTPSHHPTIRAEVARLRTQLEGFPLQLYVQSVATFDLIARTLDHASLYFVQRAPEELAAFHWVMDAKERANPVTPWEEWWTTCVKPILQSRSARQPIQMLEGADYSHFDRFMTEWQSWAFPGKAPPADSKAVDLTKVLTESFVFSDQALPGLELVDILTNALRRCLVGNLAEPGWRNLPRLMIHRPQTYMNLIALEDIGMDREVPYARQVRAFMRDGRSMLTRG